MLTEALPISVPPPTTHAMEGMVGNLASKPSLEEVLDYAEKQADKALRDSASQLPAEHKDEIRQKILIRAWKAYATLDASQGWKSFIQHHAKGAVKDYQRSGEGWKESRWDETRTKPEAVTTGSTNFDDPSPDTQEAHEPDNALECLEGDDLISVAPNPAPAPSRFKPRLSQRVSTVNSEDDRSLDVEEIAGIAGVFADPRQLTAGVRWELVARMASVDRELHLVAKLIRGFTQQQLAQDAGCTREMLSQRFYGFIANLDSPENYHSRWWAQIIFALGLCEEYGMPDQDQALGWDLPPVDLDSPLTISLMPLMKQEEFQL